MRIGIQLPVINTFKGAVWGDEVMAAGLARVLSEQEGVAFAEVYDPVTIHDNLDIILNLYPFPILRHVRGPRHYWWYQAGMGPQLLNDPGWADSLSLYDGFFAASPRLREHLIGWGVPWEKTAVMPMSCDLNVYTPGRPADRYSHEVVFCGNGGIRTHGNVERYLVPLKDLGLKIYGSEWEKYSELKGCLMGPISPSEVPVLYSSSKIVISNHTPWHFENDLPTSRLWEALACDAVVVSDRVPFAQELFGDAVAWTEGFEDVRKKVAYLLNNDEQRAKIRGKGRKIIEEELSFQAYAPKLVGIFRTGRMEELLGQRGGEEIMLKDGAAQQDIMARIDHKGDSPDAWVHSGEEAFAAGKLSEAMSCFEKALQFDPFCAKAHSNLSVVFWRQGKVEDALNSLTRALELDPNDQGVILNCSDIFQSLGKGDDAKEILESYLFRKPWDDEVRRQLDALNEDSRAHCTCDPADFFNEQGELQFRKGNLPYARACFDMALENNPAHASAHGNLGVVLWEGGDLEGALNQFYSALDLNPEDPDILLNSSKALYAAGELETAAELLKVYLQKQPQDETIWEEYSSILQELRTYGWKPGGLSSEVADIYIEMGKKLAEAGDMIGAGDAIEKCLKISPARVEAHYLLGRLHLQLDQKEEALDILREGLRIDPSHKGTVLMLGDILASREDVDAARQVYQGYLDDSSDEEVQAALDRLVTSDGSCTVNVS